MTEGIDQSEKEPTSKIYARDDLEKLLFTKEPEPTLIGETAPPEADGSSPIYTVDESTLQSPIETLQSKYFLVLLPAGYFVVDGQELLRVDNSPINYNRQDTARLMLRREIKRLFPQADADAVVKEFYDSPSTTCYEGVEFNPRETTPGFLNFYRGPAIEPFEGNCEEIKRFLFEVICDKDPIVSSYLTKYLAHMVQLPWEKPGVMISLLGGQGTGKGTFAKLLRSIWASSYVQVYNTESILGTFNSALERAFVVFMDEALFVGDRRATNALKSLVTESIIEVNEKHQPKRQIESFHRLFFATNAAHLKHTERDDRRDLSLRVSEQYKGDHAYWATIHKEIEANAGAYLKYLMGVNLSGFNVREKPATQELLEQKLRSLDGINRWWFNVLESGVIDGLGEWPDFIATKKAIELLQKAPGVKMYLLPIDREFVRTLTSLCPSAETHQKRVEGVRQRGLMLPSLDQARRDFEAWIGSAIDW